MTFLYRTQLSLLVILFLICSVSYAQQSTDTLKKQNDGPVLLKDTVAAVDSIPVKKDSATSARYTPFRMIPLRDSLISIKVYKETYSKPRPWRFLLNVPGDMWQIAKSPFKKENLGGLAIVAAATALLIPLDQPALDGVKHLSEEVHLQPQTDYKVVFKVGDTKILKYPKNFNSALYQLGEGGTSLAIAGGLFIYGKINNDYRALQTANDLAETFISMGLTTQIIKRISGRQSPFMSTQRGGKWTPFPSFSDYQSNTSNYDAFPSGHLATMMATVTVLSLNYPEKKWIKPVGYSLMGLASWAMMNTEVHWIGDYPLALALGYLSGKITYWRHHKKTPRRLVVL